MKRRRRGQRGFTLVELLIAMVVTIFGVMAMMALHVSLAQGTNTATVTQEAVVFGNQTIEELRGKRATDMMQALTGSSTNIPPVSVSTYKTVVGRTQSFTIDVDVAAVATNLWRIRVVVNWTDDSGATPHAIPFELIRTVQEVL